MTMYAPLPRRTARQNRTRAFVDILAILAELPLDDAIALVTTLSHMRTSGALQLALADDLDPPIPIRPEDP